MQLRQQLNPIFLALFQGVILGLVLLVVPAVYADDEDEKIEVVEPGHTLFGKSYNQLAGAWWNWASKEPISNNVITDPDGSRCHLNQNGRIWYLAGTFGGFFGEPPVAHRDCEVPVGKAIFFPIYNGLSYAPEFPDAGNPCLGFENLQGNIVDAVRCDVNDDLAVPPDVVLSVTINGQSLPDLLAYRAQTQPGGFKLNIPVGSLWHEFGSAPGDRFPAVADGYWILLKPLPLGMHHISFGADFDTDGIPDLGVNYTLFIVDDAVNAKVTFPSDTGIPVARGETLIITWAGFTGSNVRIQLFKNGRYERRITPFSYTENDGVFSWTVPTFLEPAPNPIYKVKVISLSDPSQSDESDESFTIQ